MLGKDRLLLAGHPHHLVRQSRDQQLVHVHEGGLVPYLAEAQTFSWPNLRIGGTLTAGGAGAIATRLHVLHRVTAVINRPALPSYNYHCSSYRMRLGEIQKY